MPKKKTAENEAIVPVQGGAAAAAAKSPVPKARAPRASASAVTHKHKKTTVAVAVEPTTVESAAPAAAPTREAIAKLAYSYWEARGYQGGSEQEDWLRAEAELRG